MRVVNERQSDVNEPQPNTGKWAYTRKVHEMDWKKDSRPKKVLRIGVWSECSDHENSVNHVEAPMFIVKFKNEAELNKAGLIVDPATNEAVSLLVGLTRAVNQRCAKVRKMFGEIQSEIVEIGKELMVIRAHLQENRVPGGFDSWVASDFEESRSQAYRYVGVATVFGDCPNLGQYDLSAMYLLAAPGTPQEAREEARQLAESGEFVDYTTAARIIEKHKADAQGETEIEEDTEAGKCDEDQEGACDGHENEEEDDNLDDADEDDDENEEPVTQQPERQHRRRSATASSNKRNHNWSGNKLKSTVIRSGDQYEIKLLGLEHGSGHEQHDHRITRLTRNQLEALRHQIDEVLANTSEQEGKLLPFTPLPAPTLS